MGRLLRLAAHSAEPRQANDDSGPLSSNGRVPALSSMSQMTADPDVDNYATPNAPASLARASVNMTMSQVAS